MIRLKQTWHNEATGLTVTLTPVAGTENPEIIQVDAYGPCDYNGRRAWIFPADDKGMLHATVKQGGKRERQIMTVNAFKAFIAANGLVLTEEEIVEKLGDGKTRKVTHEQVATVAAATPTAKPNAKTKRKGK